MELFELPKEMPIACRSAEPFAVESSVAMLSGRVGEWWERKLVVLMS